MFFCWRDVRVATATESEDTPDSAVTAAGCPEEGFFFLRGHRDEDERWPTTLQVRHVFGERIHQAWTFSPNSSKRVGASKGSSAGVLITRSQRRVIHWRVAMRCGPISTISPCGSNCFRMRVSKTVTVQTGTLESLTKVYRGSVAWGGRGVSGECPGIVSG